GPDEESSDWRFGRGVVSLLRHPRRRHALAAAAERHARERSAPDRTVERYLTAFEAARSYVHASRRPLEGTDNHWMNAGRQARWMAITGIVAGLGLLKPPAVLNRHGRKQPSWQALRDGGGDGAPGDRQQAFEADAG